MSDTAERSHEISLKPLATQKTCPINISTEWAIALEAIEDHLSEIGVNVNAAASITALNHCRFMLQLKKDYQFKGEGSGYKRLADCLKKIVGANEEAIENLYPITEQLKSAIAICQELDKEHLKYQRLARSKKARKAKE